MSKFRSCLKHAQKGQPKHIFLYIRPRPITHILMKFSHFTIILEICMF